MSKINKWEIGFFLYLIVSLICFAVQTRGFEKEMWKKDAEVQRYKLLALELVENRLIEAGG